MSVSVIKEGKNVNEAISLALEELGVNENEVDIEILEEGSKAVLGLFGGKEAKVRVTIKKSPKMAAAEFIKNVLDKMDVAATVSVVDEDDKIKVDISGDNVGILIGRRGDTLDALQYLTSLIVNKNSGEYKKVIIDVENYRLKREETLIKLAKRTADKVVKSRRNVTLEPMNPYERRIIHSALQDNNRIETYSIGEDPNRRIVIRYKR